MGRKYYCDFCDKSFSDSSTIRKNHTNGIHHQRMRTAHYDAFKDASVRYAEEMRKTPCRIFFNQGECKFGSMCRFSHMTPEERHELFNQTKPVPKPKKTTDDSFSLSDWLKKWRTKHGIDESEAGEACSISDPPKPETETERYELPPRLQGIPNLPPSLLPPPPGAFSNKHLEEWG